MDKKGQIQLTDEELKQVNGGTGQKFNYFTPAYPFEEDGRSYCLNYEVKIGGDLCPDCIYNGTQICVNGWCSGQSA